jgi:hypothetical protein
MNRNQLAYLITLIFAIVLILSVLTLASDGPGPTPWKPGLEGVDP